MDHVRMHGEALFRRWFSEWSTSRVLRGAALKLLIPFAATLAAQPAPPLQPLDTTGRVTYFVAEGEPGSGYRASDRELAAWAVGAWEASLDGALRFEPADEDEALVRLYWVPANGGQYGEMRSLLVNGRRGSAVYIRPDTSALGSEIARLTRADPLLRDTIVYLTCVHELGHALGLAHTAAFGDIMYFFGYGGDIPRFFGRFRDQLRTRGDIARTPGLSADDVRRVRNLYSR